MVQKIDSVVQREMLAEDLRTCDLRDPIYTEITTVKQQLVVENGSYTDLTETTDLMREVVKKMLQQKKEEIEWIKSDEAFLNQITLVTKRLDSNSDTFDKYLYDLVEAGGTTVEAKAALEINQRATLLEQQRLQIESLSTINFVLKGRDAEIVRRAESILSEVGIESKLDLVDTSELPAGNNFHRKYVEFIKNLAEDNLEPIKVETLSINIDNVIANVAGLSMDRIVDVFNFSYKSDLYIQLEELVSTLNLQVDIAEIDDLQELKITLSTIDYSKFQNGSFVDEAIMQLKQVREDVILASNIVLNLDAIRASQDLTPDERAVLIDITFRYYALGYHGYVVTPELHEVFSLQSYLLHHYRTNMPVQVMSVICPNYDYDPLIGYTGNGLDENDPIGIVGRTFIEDYEEVITLLAKYVRIGSVNALYGDFEASELNVRKNNLGSQEEFLRNLGKSINELRNYGMNSFLGVDLFSNIAQISRETFWSIRDLLQELGEFIDDRKGLEMIEGAVNPADWVVVSMVAAAQGVLILDPASTAMARKFYKRGADILNAVMSITIENNELVMDAKTKSRLVKLLGVEHESVLDSEKMRNLVQVLQNNFSTNYQGLSSYINLHQRYKE